MTNDALSVSLLTRVIQESLEMQFSHVRVSGEISNYKHHSSGHRYFSLKDEGAQIRCVMWRTRSLSIQPFDGMKVVVSGRISVYPAQGSYQIDCVSIVPAGIGELYQAFERLKAELLQLGYFSQSHKKPLPAFPLRVGVATSATGAALRDILSTMQQRMPACTVLFRPTLVQGEGASADIAQAIRDLEAAGCDVMIVGRGGGSMEDLWAFNTREVADAIFYARTPIISAVGHETDVSIADFVADHRSATPTAAAVACTPHQADELMYDLDLIADSMHSALRDHLNEKQRIVDSWSDGSMAEWLKRLVHEKRTFTQQAAQQMKRSTSHALSLLKHNLSGIERSLQAVQPLRPLQRGFALLQRGDDVIRVDDIVSQGEHIRIVRATQNIEAEVVSQQRTASSYGT